MINGQIESFFELGILKTVNFIRRWWRFSLSKTSIIGGGYKQIIVEDRVKQAYGPFTASTLKGLMCFLA
jgi:hypothetical protein